MQQGGSGSTVCGALPSVCACPEVSRVLGLAFFRLCSYTHSSYTAPTTVRGAQSTRAKSRYLWHAEQWSPRATALSLRPGAWKPQLRRPASPGALAPQQRVAPTLPSSSRPRSNEGPAQPVVIVMKTQWLYGVYTKGMVILKGKEESVVSSKGLFPARVDCG